MNTAALAGPETRIHLPCLLTALVIMMGGTLYPPLLMDAAGRADHLLAGLALLAMSAGFVRGVGFVPRLTLLRWLFSGWTCLLTGMAFLALKILT
jgi:predicted membrane protein